MVSVRPLRELYLDVAEHVSITTLRCCPWLAENLISQDKTSLTEKKGEHCSFDSEVNASDKPV